jgi:hypothetical protein
MGKVAKTGEELRVIEKAKTGEKVTGVQKVVGVKVGSTARILSAHKKENRIAVEPHGIRFGALKY